MQPLILSSNGHPGYQPVKLNIKTAADMKSNKSKAPEKPMTPYMKYTRKVWDSVKAAHPEAKLWEIGKIIGQMWRDLSEAERQEYTGDYEIAKAEYGEQLKMYHNSPNYQNFLLSGSSKKKIGGGIGSSILGSGPLGVGGMGSSGGMVSVGGSSEVGIGIVSATSAIEPAEEDAIDDGLGTRYISAQRFTRNHRLLADIFNEFIVPDQRSVVTQARLEQLRKQVHSLETHQEKLELELRAIDDKYEAKKKRFLETSQEFNAELDKLKQLNVTDEQKSQFYTKHYEQLQKQWKDYVENFTNSIVNKNYSRETSHNFLRQGLENLVQGNRNMLSVPNPNSITVVALQQVIEPAPPVVQHAVAASHAHPQQQPPPQVPLAQAAANTLASGALSSPLPQQQSMPTNVPMSQHTHSQQHMPTTTTGPVQMMTTPTGQVVQQPMYQSATGMIAQQSQMIMSSQGVMAPPPPQTAHMQSQPTTATVQVMSSHHSQQQPGPHVLQNPSYGVAQSPQQQQPQGMMMHHQSMEYQYGTGSNAQPTYYAQAQQQQPTDMYQQTQQYQQQQYGPQMQRTSMGAPAYMLAPSQPQQQQPRMMVPQPGQQMTQQQQQAMMISRPAMASTPTATTPGVQQQQTIMVTAAPPGQAAFVQPQQYQYIQQPGPTLVAQQQAQTTIISPNQQQPQQHQYMAQTMMQQPGVNRMMPQQPGQPVVQLQQSQQQQRIPQGLAPQQQQMGQSIAYYSPQQQTIMYTTAQQQAQAPPPGYMAMPMPPQQQQPQQQTQQITHYASVTAVPSVTSNVINPQQAQQQQTNMVQMQSNQKTN